MSSVCVSPSGVGRQTLKTPKWEKQNYSWVAEKHTHFTKLGLRVKSGEVDHPIPV